MKQLHRLIKKEDGNASILFIAFMPILILMMAWSIDVARVLTVKTELYKASDAAAHEVAMSVDMNRLTQTGSEEYTADLQSIAAERVGDNTSGACGSSVTSIEARLVGNTIEIETQAVVPLMFNLTGDREVTVVSIGSDRVRRIR